jgi:shikimate dehydrogenase
VVSAAPLGIRRAAVLGSPISHSLSPALHRAAYEVLGLKWRYDAIEMSEAQLPTFLREVRTDPAWIGLSLTMPLKEQALALADSASEVANATQAANTLVVRHGRFHADNTDPVGIAWALERAGIVDVRDVDPVVLGAGATARSAIAALAGLGAIHTVVCARRPAAIAALSSVAAGLGVAITPAPLNESALLLGRGLAISTLPAGVADRLSGAIPDSPGVLLDVIYAPWPTAMAQTWASHGGTVVGGLEMLVGQAGRQIELMTGQTAPLTEMFQAGLAAQQQANR